MAALATIVVLCVGIAALVAFELVQRRRDRGRVLPVLRRMPTRRVRGRRALSL